LPIVALRLRRVGGTAWADRLAEPLLVAIDQGFSLKLAAQNGRGVLD
jgi:hypothetical protein